MPTFRCPRLLTSSGWTDDATLVVDGGRVASVRTGGPGAEPLDGAVVPGLVDLQVNGIGAHAVSDATGRAIDAISTALLAQGVTAFCPTVVSCPDQERFQRLDAIASSRAPGAHVLGAHLEGPWIARPGAHDPTVCGPPTTEAVDAALTRHAGLVRIVTLAPELGGALEAIARITEAGAVASVGHTDATVEQTLSAIDAGATMATHVFNAMRPFHHREPGAAGAVLTDPRVTCGVIADLVHLHPATVRLVAAASAFVLVSDLVATDGDRAPRLADGTLAGAGVGLGRGVAHAAQLVGLRTAVDAATRGPANLVGYEGGRLDPGAPADFVVLGDDLTPVATYVAGELVWSA